MRLKADLNSYPPTSAKGDVYYDRALDAYMYYDGDEWLNVGKEINVLRKTEIINEIKKLIEELEKL